MVNTVAQYWKGILGFITPGVVALGVALNGTSDGGDTVTKTEWVGIVVAMLLTGGLVTAKRNGVSANPTTSTPEIKPRDVGYGAIELLVAVLVVVILVLLILRLA